MKKLLTKKLLMKKLLAMKRLMKIAKMRNKVEKRSQSYKLLIRKKRLKMRLMKMNTIRMTRRMFMTTFGWMRHSINYDAYHETLSPSYNDEEMDAQIAEQIVDHIVEKMEETQEGVETQEGAGDVVVDKEVQDNHQDEGTTRPRNIHKEKKKHSQEGTFTNMEDTQDLTVTHVTVRDHGTQQLCTDDIMKKFDAMQHTTQQALTEMQHTLKGMEENYEKK
ncbi:hypothetical protein Scep_006963 [Stephania cephalantha]|uniref:Uncharacterized protein n=1 Tax=Stephania cephalantha TaxID=152367 RepID=A0AAP0K8Y8_9MAGN